MLVYMQAGLFGALGCIVLQSRVLLLTKATTRTFPACVDMVQDSVPVLVVCTPP